MKIYVINLDKDTDRLFHMKNKFSTFTRIPAIQGDNILVKRLNSSLTPAQLGCYLSHKRALQQFLREENEEYLVLLEDDVIPTSTFPKINDIIKTFPTNFDICWIGNCRGKWPRNPCNEYSEPSYEYEKLDQFNQFIWKIDGTSKDNYPIGGYGLVFSRKGAIKALELIEKDKYNTPIDICYVKSELENYMTVPSLIVHCYLFDSNIAKENQSENILKSDYGSNQRKNKDENFFLLFLLLIVIVNLFLWISKNV
jgi:GR25 family glycosyltransferase involved in LPS biosynthesis